MKLLRSTFIAFYITSNHVVSGFTPQINSKSLSFTQQYRSIAATTTSLFVGIHEQPKSQISEEEILRETMFQQVLKEVNTVKDYLGWLIDESVSSSSSDASTTDASDTGEGKTFGDVLSEQAAAGEVELFGGGGDAPSEQTPKEAQYEPAMRSDLGTTVLLSGTVDATLLNILNNNFFGQDLVSNFEFTTIKALVEDVAAAKKKAISREARYGGLLDKLVIESASSGSSMPTKEDLVGASSWIVQISGDEASSLLPQVADLAKGSEDMKNVVVMVDGTSSGTVEGWDAVVAASSDGDAFKCTLMAVGELYDGGEAGYRQEGGFYHIGPVSGDTVEAPRLSKKKAYQLLGHALALDSTAGQSLMAYEYPPASLEAVATPYAEGEFAVRDDDGKELVDELQDVKMEGRMIQAMREVGFTPVMELDVLVGKGLASYKDYLDNPPVPKETSFTKTKSARDKEDERIMAILEADSAKSEAKRKAEEEKARKTDIEGIAKEWAIKEYTLRMLGGDIDDSVSENDFIVSVHDEALAEAEKTYVRINSEEYKKEQEQLANSKKGVENKLFWDGMPPMLRKKREKMVEKVKKQYMDLLSEAELESIILNE